MTQIFKFHKITNQIFKNLVSSIKHFSIYIECNKTLVFTDHNPLTFIHKFKNHNAKLLRWSLILQAYDLEIQHVKGKENTIADWLSRSE